MYDIIYSALGLRGQPQSPAAAILSVLSEGGGVGGGAGGGVGVLLGSPNTLISNILAQLLRVFPFTVILTYRAVLSGNSYLSKPLVVPLLVPEKTSVNDLPSFETAITKLLILSVPLYDETSRLHVVFFFPISNVSDDPRPCSDHRVVRSPSIAYFGPRLGVPPVSVIFETVSLLQGLEVGGDGDGVLSAEVAKDHVLPAVIALLALSFTPVVMVTVYEVVNPSDGEGLKVTVLHRFSMLMFRRYFYQHHFSRQKLWDRPNLYRFAECGL